MSRTYISEDLVHDSARADADGAVLERLVAIAAGQALPAVRDALVRETTREVARLWVDEARAALDEVLAENAGLADEDMDAITSQLAHAFAGEVPRPDADEIQEHAAALARTLVTGWLQTLADFRSRGR